MAICKLVRRASICACGVVLLCATGTGCSSSGDADGGPEGLPPLAEAGEDEGAEGEAAGTMVDWLTSQVEDAAAEQGWSWAMQLLGLGGEGESTNFKGEFARIDHQMQVIEKELAATSNQINQLQEEFSKFVEQQTEYDLGALMTDLQTPSTQLATSSSWDIIRGQLDGQDVSLAEFAKNNCSKQWLTAIYSGKATEVFTQAATTLNALGPNLSTVWANLDIVAGQFMQALYTSPNIVEHNQSYTAFYATLWTQTLLIVQRSYNVQALGLALRFSCEEFASVGDTWALNNLKSGGAGLEAELPGALQSLNAYYKKNYVAPLMVNLENLPKTVESKTVYDHFEFSLAKDFSPTCTASFLRAEDSHFGDPTDVWFQANCKDAGKTALYQMYIPTYKGKPMISNLRFQSGFGLIGDIDDDLIQQSLNAGSGIPAHLTQDEYGDVVPGTTVNVSGLWNSGMVTTVGTGGWGSSNEWMSGMTAHVGVDEAITVNAGFEWPWVGASSWPPESHGYGYLLTPTGRIVVVMVSSNGEWVTQAVPVLYRGLGAAGLGVNPPSWNGNTLTWSDGTKVALDGSGDQTLKVSVAAAPAATPQ